MHHALMVLGWYELPEEDQPPEQIWLDPEALDLHWKELRQRRKEERGGSDDDYPDSADLMENDLAKAWRNAD